MSDHPRLLHPVLDATDARALAEFWRELLGLVHRPGAELRLDRSHDEDEPLSVLADPAGHPFCLLVG